VSAKAQAKKDKIISGLVETRGKILDAASSLSAAEQDEVFLGVWSVKDLLAHLVGWDFTSLEAAKAILAGKIPSFYSYHDRDWLVDFLEAIPAEEFDKDRGVRFKGYKVTIARLLQVEIDDEKTHLTQVEGFRDRNNPSPGEKP